MSSAPVVHLDLDKLSVQTKDLLSKILDRNDLWEELGRLMQFTECDLTVNIFFIEIPNESPAYQLLFFFLGFQN